MKKTDFYIGWKDEMASSSKSYLRNRLVIILLAIPLIAFAFVYGQKAFKNHTFKLGQISSITGIYFDEPFPILIAEDGQYPLNSSREILLVGYGKFGAEGIMDAIQKDKGNLIGKRITLDGTLIYGDGKTLMELTKKTKSIRAVFPSPRLSTELSSPKKAVNLKGEILDPKCYFGVMKPGEGKIHKSCAIRCISGGIPPVFRSGDGINVPYTYHLMVDDKGNKVNEEILTYVGEQITLQGRSNSMNGWDVIYTDLSTLSYLEN